MAKKKAVEVDKSVRLFHYGRPMKDDPGDHNGVISIASKADYEKKEVAVGFGFCSPLDEFRRGKGRNISTGRQRKNTIVLKFDDNPGKAIRKFLVCVWDKGKTVYDSGISNKALQLRLREFYIALRGSLIADSIVTAAPYNALKHFPFAFPWAQDVKFPVEWAE